MHAFIILHNMIIDDERDSGYEASTSLTSILQREAHLTSGFMFLNIQSNFMSMCATIFTKLMYLFI
jgi:hypothetical protein